VKRLFLIALALASILAATAHGIQAQSPSRSPELTVTGRVTDVVGRRFLIDADQGRTLVDPVDAPSSLNLSPGDRISVTGSVLDGILLARRIVTVDGALLFERSAGPGLSNVDATLASLHLTPTSSPVRKKRKVEVTAQTAEGRKVYVTFDRFGRIDEIEDADHDKKRVVAIRTLARTDFEELARRAGFEPLDDFEQKKDSVEILVRNRSGELLELHMDRNGYIYKREWVR